ncbi:MAG: hypothetical protein J7M25_10320 [Deltaproteobacteria bacterium]|nr:hypothetical protein [Deltaproteobacteria bacterium]
MLEQRCPTQSMPHGLLGVYKAIVHQRNSRSLTTSRRSETAFMETSLPQFGQPTSILLTLDFTASIPFLEQSLRITAAPPASATTHQGCNELYEKRHHGEPRDSKQAIEIKAFVHVSLQK